MTQKSTKSRLLLSALSLLVCISMFVGSTFAWFTDSVSSVNNIIKSGNLDVEVEYSYDGETWTKLENSESIFKDTLWEPGHTQAVALRVSNVGSLALKYSVATNIVSEKTGINVYGKEFKLSEVLKLGHSAIQQDGQVGDIYMGMLLGKRDSALQANWIGFGAPVQIPTPELLPSAAHVMVLVITMPETVGNEANHKTNEAGEDNQPKITFGVTVNATQLMHEEDSFGKDYDAGAEYGKVLFKTEDIRDAAGNGEDFVLGDDMNVTADQSTPYGNKTGLIHKGGVFDGNGKTLTVDSTGDNWGIMTYGGTIKNVTVKGVFRGIVSYGVKEDLILDNVHVVGEDIGYGFNTAEHATVNNARLIVTNSSFTGWKSFAGGFVSASFDNCEFTENNYFSDPDANRLVKPYIDTVFKNCEFAAKTYMDLSALANDAIVTFENCTVGGVALTEENCEDLFSCIELHSGISMANVEFK